MTDKTIKKILSARIELLCGTDSDIEDFARANRLHFDDVLRCLANHATAYKQCWGCEHIADRFYHSNYDRPCGSCSRRIITEDRFISDKRRYRMRDDCY